MILVLSRKFLVVLLAITASIGGNIMATPEIEKKLYADIAKGFLVAPVTASDRAIAKAYQDASNAIVLPPPVVVPPIVTPPPVNTNWPRELSANPTGPKKPLPGRVVSLTITEDNKIIDGFNAEIVYVKANNVTLKNGLTRAIKKDPGKTGLIIEDSKIDGENMTENAVEWNEYVCRRTEVTRTTDAFKGHGNTEIDSCWIHDLNFQTGAGTGAGGFSHNDGLQTSSGNNVKVVNTRLENMRGNAGLYIQADQGPISNVVLQNNYLSNVGNYMIYVKESVTAPQNGLPTNVTIIGNTFGKRPDYLDPNWGEMKAEVRATNLVWQNNKTVDGKNVILNSWGKGETQS